MHRIFLTSLLILLAACSSSADLPEPPGLGYLAQQPFRLKVARIEVVKQYQSSSIAPHVENEMPMPPAAMIHQWTQDRLVPVGKTGYAVVTIEDASVVETPLKRTSGFQAMFTVDQSERYDAKVSVKIEIFDDAGNSKGSAYARAQSSRSVAENLTLGQRRKIWIYMIEKLISHLDAELDLNVKSYLGTYLEP